MHGEFSSLLNERLKARGFSMKKLSELSGIALEHLENFSVGAYDKLPAAPYVRGYISTLAKILDFDPSPWLISLERTGGIASSGASDELPKNRFSRSGLRKPFLIIVLITILVFYVGIRFPHIFGQPDILINLPQDPVMTVHREPLLVSGGVVNGDDLSINGEPVTVSPDGSWELSLPLTPGLNTIVVTAKKFLGRETRIIRQVLYEPPAETSSPPGR